MNKTNQKRLRGIGTFWHGSRLGILERSCLVSMQEQGHQVTLFSHDDVRNVPSGVKICDARAISGDLLEEFSRPVRHIRHEHIRRGHSHRIPMTFSDIFRCLMIRETNLMWADLDAFLLKPLEPENGNLFAWMTEKHVANGVLALPTDSLTLKDMIKFTKNHYPIPPFYRVEKRIALMLRKIVGKPKHISLLGGTVAGPDALTYFLRKHREDHRALPTKSLYPISHTDTHIFFFPFDQVQEEYLQDSLSVHLWGSWFNTKIQDPTKIPSGTLLHECLMRGK